MNCTEIGKGLYVADINMRQVKLDKDNKVKKTGLYDSAIFVDKRENMVTVLNKKERLSMSIRYDELVELLLTLMSDEPDGKTEEESDDE